MLIIYQFLPILLGVEGRLHVNSRAGFLQREPTFVLAERISEDSSDKDATVTSDPATSAPEATNVTTDSPDVADATSVATDSPDVAEATNVTTDTPDVAAPTSVASNTTDVPESTVATVTANTTDATTAAPVSDTNANTTAVIADWAYCTCGVGPNGALVYADRQWPAEATSPNVEPSLQTVDQASDAAGTTAEPVDSTVVADVATSDSNSTTVAPTESTGTGTFLPEDSTTTVASEDPTTTVETDDATSDSNSTTVAPTESTGKTTVVSDDSTTTVAADDSLNTTTAEPPLVSSSLLQQPHMSLLEISLHGKRVSIRRADGECRCEDPWAGFTESQDANCSLSNGVTVCLVQISPPAALSQDEVDTRANDLLAAIDAEFDSAS